MGIGFRWGPDLGRIGPTWAVVVVDVLSWSTATSVAVGRGIAVYPHPWPDPDPDEFAARVGAEVAVTRRRVSLTRPWSLSPAALLRADPPPSGRLVLPSPNGSALAVAAAATGATVIAGCLRNASAVAAWVRAHGFGPAGRPAVVVAAGERWPSGRSRWCVEDYLGAGAILAALGGDLAPAAAWMAHRRHAGDHLRRCLSGRELSGAGFDADVDLAAEVDADATVPVLTDGAFRPQPS